MKCTFTLLAVLLLAPMVTLHAADAPRLVAPADGSVMYAPHPHFRWQREEDVKIDEVHRIQIARDEKFADAVCDDRLEVVSRFVPVKPLAPGRYWWRVRRGEGDWCAAIPFEVRVPTNVFTIDANSDEATIARIIQEAASNCPALVNFEPGEYRVATNVPKGKSAVEINGAHDLILDGHGARLVAGGTFLSVSDSQRVTIQHFTVTPDKPGHTLVRILKKDEADEKLFVKEEPGYDPDVPRFFEHEGNGGSFLGCMDEAHHGKYLPGAGVSAHESRIAPVPEIPGAFVIAPVSPATLAKIPTGAVAVVTVYRTQWVQLNRTEECTFSDVTVSGLPGAFCGGSENSAKSYLACRVMRAKPEDFFGGHSAVENGRIGNWIEGCTFECLPDDGPCTQSLRMTIARTDGDDAVVLKDDWTNRDLRPGDRITIMGTKDGCGAGATLRSVSPGRRSMRLQFDRPLRDLAAELGPEFPSGWTGARLYRDEPNNTDLVYRRNRHVGGRGHGIKYNGTRAWFADNHFENISGNAIVAGFSWKDGLEGHSARDVVISGNTIINCGWSPIEASSISGRGGNIIIRSNCVNEVRDAAIHIRGCGGVRITGNTFSSTTPPEKGMWINVENSADVQYEDNRAPGRFPMIGKSEGHNFQ